MEYEENEEEVLTSDNSKDTSKTNALWGVIADFIINSKENHFKKHIGIIDRTLHYRLDQQEDQLYSPKKGRK